MPNYNETVGRCAPDSLIAGNTIPVHTASATIAASEGQLQRGTVLAMGTDGKMKLLSTESAGASEVPYGILCDDVDATTETVAEVYVSGQFNRNALTTKESYALTAADVKALRDGGIYLENTMISKEDV
jgi:hypothetical protein